MTLRKGHRIRLTCRCGATHTLNNIKDLRSRCTNERCHAALSMAQEELWEYQESIAALMEAMGLGRDYARELGNARSVSIRLSSPYTIDIVEVPE